MGSYKVCVYTICKNEAQFVERWMDSMSEADCVVVLDTGGRPGGGAGPRHRGQHGGEAAGARGSGDGRDNLPLAV